MPSPIVHSQQGLTLAALLLKHWQPTLSALGLEWLLPPIILVLGYLFHIPLDAMPHIDTVAFGTQEDYDKSMKWDPKKLVHEIGLWPAYTPSGREQLRVTHPLLADPQPVEIARTPMIWALGDVAVAGILTLICLWPYLGNPFLLICLGAGALGTVMPDLVLVKQIHQVIIKSDLYWRLDYTHHWFHATVMKRKDLVFGILLQVVYLAFFGWAAWSLRPHP